MEQDPTGPNTFVQALTDQVNRLLSSQLDGPFTPITHPNGLPFFWELSNQGLYNAKTLSLIDRIVAVDQFGLGTLSSGTFSGLYLQILDHTQYALSVRDERENTDALEAFNIKADALVQAYEASIKPITEQDILDSGAFPATKLAFAQDQIAARWGEPAQFPSTLPSVNKTFQEWRQASQTLDNLLLRQKTAQDRLQAAKANAAHPTDQNGGAKITADTFRTAYSGFRPIGVLKGSLDHQNALRVTWTLSGLGSDNVRADIEGRPLDQASAENITFTKGTGQPQPLKSLRGAATKVTVSIVYPGVTLFQAEPLGLSTDLVTGWYDEQLLQQHNLKTSGYRLTGDLLNPDHLFGDKGQLARVKTFVISREPTIELTFVGGDHNPLKGYSTGEDVEIGLAGPLNFKVTSQGAILKQPASPGADSTLVRFSPSTPSTLIPLQNQTAFIIGGVIARPTASPQKGRPALDIPSDAVSASRINCVNTAAFVMKFRVRWGWRQVRLDADLPRWGGPLFRSVHSQHPPRHQDLARNQSDPRRAKAVLGARLLRPGHCPDHNLQDHRNDPRRLLRAPRFLRSQNNTFTQGKTMAMNDWQVTNHTDPNHGNNIWVYYQNPAFPNIHFSRSVSNPAQDHMATNDHLYYYFGVTNTFNGVVPQHIQAQLIAAWANYFTVAAPQPQNLAAVVEDCGLEPEQI